MDSKEADQNYSLDRKTASRLLKVSIRTIDRYVKSKKLSTYVVGGRVWLNRKEIEEIGLGNEARGDIGHVDMSRVEVSTDRVVDSVDNFDVLDETGVDSLSIRKKQKTGTGTVYKKLYADLKEELKEKQERLEIANYRVGQLEAQIRNSIPMLEYHNEQYENKKKESELALKLEEQTEIIKKTMAKLRYEKFNKRIFLIILLFILALQPIWILFLYGN